MSKSGYRYVGVTHNPVPRVSNRTYTKKGDSIVSFENFTELVTCSHMAVNHLIERAVLQKRPWLDRRQLFLWVDDNYFSLSSEI